MTFEEWRATYWRQYHSADFDECLREVWAAAASAERERCWREINAHIKEGPLGGNGTDKTAERNGLILAANAIAQMRPA